MYNQTFFDSLNGERNGMIRFLFLAGGITNYGSAGMVEGTSQVNGVTPFYQHDCLGTGSDIPAATVTGLTIWGSVLNAAITLGVDEMQVYSYAIS